MARGLIGGMTDYSHQSLEDIIGDLLEEANEAQAVARRIEAKLTQTNESGYWGTTVPTDFRAIVGYSLRHYKTSANEMTEIAADIRTAVQDHHCKRLRRIANVADEINRDIGRIWHQDYDEKEYGDPDFRIVEDMYKLARDEAVSLLDMGNISNRLSDFIGRSQPMRSNNPWKSGSFYVFLFVIVLGSVAAVSRVISWAAFPFVIIAGVLFIVLVGAFQLRNDERLREESFVTLIVESFRRLPLLRSKRK